MMNSWFKSNIYEVLGTLSVIALVIGFPILNHYFSWVETDWTSYLFEILIVAILAIIIFWLMKHFLNKIKCADSVALQYRAAKQFIRTVQWGHFLIFLLPLLTIDAIKDGDMGFSIFFFCVYMIFAILAPLFKPNLFIDKDFYNDVEELDEYE